MAADRYGHSRCWRIRHRLYMFVCLTRWYGPLDWWAHRSYPIKDGWAWRLAWSIQRRQNNLWNRYADRRCQESEPPDVIRIFP